MKAFYYYQRDGANRPCATHCFVTDGKTYARGTALCSIDDNPCKKTGRRIAYSRAMRSFFTQTDKMGHDIKVYGGFPKYMFMPEMRPIEHKFMKAAKQLKTPADSAGKRGNDDTWCNN